MFNFKKIFLLSILFLIFNQKKCAEICPEVRITVLTDEELAYRQKKIAEQQKQSQYDLVKKQVISSLAKTLDCKAIEKQIMKNLIKANFAEIWKVQYEINQELSTAGINEIYNELMKQ